MSIDMSTIECCHGREKKMVFTLLQGKEILAVAEIWHTQGLKPILEKIFVKEKARRRGFWRYLMERQLKWLQENSNAQTVQLYIDENSPIINALKGYGFQFTGEANEDDGLWMVKQLKI